MLMVTTALEWKTPDEGDLVHLTSQVDDQYEDVLDIPTTTQPPPPPPKQIIMPEIIEVPDEEIIINDLDVSLDIEIKEATVIEEYEYDFSEAGPEKEEAEEIFVIVEEFPEPEGGMVKFYEYIAANLDYPKFAQTNNITGKVFVEFIIRSDGEMQNVNVLKGIGGGCDEEAVRVVRQSVAEIKWVPGNQRGVPVNVRMVLPLTFSIE